MSVELSKSYIVRYTSGLEVLLDEDKEIWRPVDLSAADSAVHCYLVGAPTSAPMAVFLPHYIELAMDSFVRKSKNPDFGFLRFGKFRIEVFSSFSFIFVHFSK